MSITGNLFSPADVTRIRERLATLEPDTEGQWGRMTAHQALCHQADALRMAVGQTTPKPVKAPMPLFLLRIIALRLPMAWPQGVKTVREADQEKDGTPPGDFKEDRDRLDQLIQEFSELAPSKPDVVHPIFGKLSRADWGRWAYRHSDHHLRQFGV